MRISVCEFLRLKTEENWFFSKRGTWVNASFTKTATREEDFPDIINIRTKGRSKAKALRYFAGMTSHDVRALVRRRRRS